MQEIKKENRDYYACCYCKEPFETWALADKVKKHMCRRDTGRLTIYKCPFCGKFHIGTNDRKKKLKIY